MAGLSGEIGKQIRYQNPPNLHQALTTAIAVIEAVKHERFAETYTKFDKSVRISSRGGSEGADERYSPMRATNTRVIRGTSVT